MGALGLWYPLSDWVLALLIFFIIIAFKNGILPVVLTPAEVDSLFVKCAGEEGFTLTVDLETQRVTGEGQDQEKIEFTFTLDAFRRECLLKGLDDIGLTLEQADKIRAYEAKRQHQAPWLFASP